MEKKTSSFKIALYLFSPFKKIFVLYLIGIILLSLLEIFRVSLVYPIINNGLEIDNSVKMLDFFFDAILPSGMNPFVSSCLLLLISTVVIFVVFGIVSYLGAYFFAVVRDSLDKQVFEKICSRPYSFFAAKKQGDLIYTGQTAVNDAGIVVDSLVDVIKNLLMAFLYFLFLIYMSYQVTIAVACLGAVYAYLVKKELLSRIYRNSSVVREASMEKSVIYQEFVSGIKTVFITGSVLKWKEKYLASVQKLYKSYLNVIALSKVPVMANDFIMFSIIAAGGLLLYIATNGDFLPYIGAFGVCMLGLYRMVPSLTAAQQNLSNISRYMPSLELVYNTITEDEGDVKREQGTKPFVFNDKLEFRDVTFKYAGRKNPTLSNISLAIPKNKRIAIVGSSGSGKTTTANLLALLYNPDKGGIYADGVNLSEISPAEYLKALGYIGQETFIFHDTIKENIRFGMDCTDEDIIRAAKLADAHDFISKTPEGYNTLIGDQGIKLSGGQRQRVAIARIILRNPQILLLDEATSSLDNISEQKIMESVEKLSKDMTVITIAHRLSTIQNADTIYVMSYGSVAESGTHEELMRRKGAYYNLYMRQDSVKHSADN